MALFIMLQFNTIKLQINQIYVVPNQIYLTASAANHTKNP